MTLSAEKSQLCPDPQIFAVIDTADWSLAEGKFSPILATVKPESTNNTTLSRQRGLSPKTAGKQPHRNAQRLPCPAWIPN